MKAGLILIIIVILSVAGYFILFKKSDTRSAIVPDQPLVISKNSPSFNQPFNALMDTYYQLEAALVNWDTAAASSSAQKVADLASRVPYGALRADSGILQTARSFSDKVIAASRKIAGDTSINDKRHSFYTLSENLYNLVRTVHYDQAVIYHDKCPMAFGGDQEGYWITRNRDIANPYLGNKHPKYHAAMVTCGSIEDSIDYRQP